MAVKNTKQAVREGRPRMSSQQKKIRRQQIFMAVVGIVLVLTMILALVIR
jgi:hypothetical protein